MKYKRRAKTLAEKVRAANEREAFKHNKRKLLVKLAKQAQRKKLRGE
jgi:hypothetical protein